MQPRSQLSINRVEQEAGWGRLALPRSIAVQAEAAQSIRAGPRLAWRVLYANNSHLIHHKATSLLLPRTAAAPPAQAQRTAGSGAMQTFEKKQALARDGCALVAIEAGANAGRWPRVAVAPAKKRAVAGATALGALLGGRPLAWRQPLLSANYRYLRQRPLLPGKRQTQAAPGCRCWYRSMQRCSHWGPWPSA